MSSLEEFLGRGLDSIYPNKELFAEKLNSKDQITIYYGIDPTSTSIHIGHAILLRKLRQLQDMGHKVILLFGDFTAMIGDPSERQTQRQPLTRDQVLKNVESYKDQVSKIIDFKTNPATIKFNSTWWDKMTVNRFFDILPNFSVAQLLERDMFQQRMKNEQSIAVSEFLYPILQGYDSIEMDVDAEIGGSDQTFNMLAGRKLLKIYKNKEKFVITTPLLEGADGKKMSKSLGNDIPVNLVPDQMFGKVMSIKDDLIPKYFTLTTNINSKEIEEISSALKNKKSNPMAAKKKLAFEITQIYHGKEKAAEAQREFERVFQKKGTPTASVFKIKKGKISIIDLLMEAKLVASRSEAKRLVTQGGVDINGKAVTNIELPIEVRTGTIVRAGKLRAAEVSLKDS